MAKETCILEMKQIRKSFEGKEVLKDISLKVNEGEVVSIIGPSGSGKSTLLRCATFLEQIDGGDITYSGKPVVKAANYPGKKELWEAGQQFGLVFQNFNLFPHFSVIKNITDAPIHNQKRKKEEVFAEARELLKKVGLEEKEDAYPCELSGGQNQRVAIARALAMHPKMLFFDEPTSALDPELVGEVLNTIKSLAEEGTTMILVTHEIGFAREVASRILFMDGGRIAADGRPEEIIDHPENQRLQQFLNFVNRK